MTRLPTLSAPVIESDRVVLRKARDTDWKGIVEVMTDPEVRTYLGGPPLKIVYLLIRRILRLAVLISRRRWRRMLSCWHSATRTRCSAATSARSGATRSDRLWLAALAQLIPRRRWAEIFPITPATMLACHRRLAAGKYDTSKRRTPGRPQPVGSITRLVVNLAKENHRLGDPARRGHRSGAAPRGADLAAVPARPGRRDPRGPCHPHVDTMLLKGL